MAQILTFPSAGKLQGLYQPAFAAALQAAAAATPPTSFSRPLLTAETMRARCARFIAPAGSAHR